jgi:hypothetical protein
LVVESSSEKEEEEGEDTSNSDDEDMALFMKKFKKYVKKKKFSKRENKFKTKTKRTCYNYGKYDHFITNCPFENRDDDDKKKKYMPYKNGKDYKISAQAL